ncbi:MAG: penicillin-binding protein 2, partial [Chloroflexi bacterium]|nr:penicillin-binding protein 2 [Chloroflexota bacterium]
MKDWYVKSRFIIFRVVVLLSFSVLGLRLWELQIVSSETYQRSADTNRFRLVPIDAPRGIIYDRYGRMLVRNIPSFTVSIVPGGLPDEDDPEFERVLKRISELVGIPSGLEPTPTPQPSPAPASTDSPAEATAETTETPSPETSTPKKTILSILDDRTLGQWRKLAIWSPIRIATNVDREAAFILEEEHLQLPGVVVTAEPLREYLDGPLTAHLLGYVGSIPETWLDSYISDKEAGYETDDMIGLAGIEYSLEDILRGTKGQKHIEVDAYEREVAVLASEPPIPGNNLLLTIDLDLQRFVEDVLRQGMAKAKSKVGVAIVMDPRTGAILASVSLPNYDNNLFSGGISYEDYAALLADENRPMMNHAVSGQYPPGSTFKIVSASGALQEHAVDVSTRLTCNGTLYLPNRYAPDDWSLAQPFYCWRRAGHGSLNVVDAIAQSCDIFFYQAIGGYRDFRGLGYEGLAKYANMFGYGERLGIDLPGELAGLIPSDQWKRQNYGEHWLTGDTYNASIGQGFILATPLQVVNATAAIANKGTLYRPQLVYQVTDAEGRVIDMPAPEPIRQLEVSQRNIELVRQGMLQAVERGSARLAQVPGVRVAGKTGSAEYPAVDEHGNLILNPDGTLPTHAWFTAFAPFEDPEIAVVVFLEGGGEGSQTAA